MDLNKLGGKVLTGCIWLRIRNQWQALGNTVVDIRVP
jgi:hypothetical protein